MMQLIINVAEKSMTTFHKSCGQMHSCGNHSANLLNFLAALTARCSLHPRSSSLTQAPVVFVLFQTAVSEFQQEDSTECFYTRLELED